MLSAFARPAMARASVKVPVSTRQMSTNGQGGFSGFLNGDSGNLSTSFFHKLNTVIMVSTPLACGSLFTDSITFRPFEVVLGLALPLHGHIGMNYVITDYVKKFFGKSMVAPARGLMVGVTGVTVLGLMKVNFMHGGIIHCVKALWTGDGKKK